MVTKSTGIPTSSARRFSRRMNRTKPIGRSNSTRMIDITAGTLLPAHHRTEDADPNNAEFGTQLLPALSDDPDDVVNGIHRIHSKIQRVRVPWMNDEETTETRVTRVGV